MIESERRIVLVFLITLLCISFALFGFIRHKFLLNPLTVMGIIWAIIIPISSLNLYGTYPVSEYAYFIILVGLIAFFFGASIGSGKKQVVLIKKNMSDRIQIDYEINYRLLYIINFIAIIYYLIQFFRVIELLLSGMDYSAIRTLFVAQEENVLRSSRILVIIRSFIATPATYLGIAMLPMEMMVNRNKNLISQILLMSFLWVFTSGGRSILIWFGIYLLATFLFVKQDIDIDLKKIIKNNIIKIILISVFVIVFFFQITFSRRGEDVDLINQMFIYFVAPIKFFDFNLWKVKLLQPSTFGFGFSSFYGFLYPISFLFSTILGDHPEFVLNIHDLSFMDLEQTVHLGGETYMNAFASIFYHPYVDGRIIGVILILLFYGFIVGKVFFKAKYEYNQKFFLIYLLLLQQISFAFVRFYFTQTGQVLTLIFAILIFKKVESNKRNRV